MAFRRKTRDIDSENGTAASTDLQARDDDLMVLRDDDLIVRRSETERPVMVRGGLSLLAITTGAMTAIGVMMMLAAIVGGIVATTSISAGELRGDITDYGMWAALALVFAQFFAYVWGGYAAGRMARGMGSINGILVPVFTLAIGAIVVAIVDALGADAAINLPYIGSAALPVTDSEITSTGAGVGLAALAAMFLGGTFGGILGARWHARLEDPELRPHARQAA